MSTESDIKAAFKTTADGLTAVAPLTPEPLAMVLRILAAAAKVGGELIGDGRTEAQIIASIHRAKDIAHDIAAQDAAAAAAIAARFPHKV